MSTALIFILIIIDLVLLGVVYFLGRQRFNPIDLMKEIHEERRVLKEIQKSIREENERYHQDAKDLHKKMASLATEAEVELKSSGQTLSVELDRLMKQLSERVDLSVADLAKHRSTLSALIQKSRNERELLSKSVTRAEKLVQFFKRKVPVEEVLEEIEDKKYVDARHLLAKGLTIPEVAIEVGLSESEVNLLATLA